MRTVRQAREFLRLRQVRLATGRPAAFLLVNHAASGRTRQDVGCGAVVVDRHARHDDDVILSTISVDKVLSMGKVGGSPGSPWQAGIGPKRVAAMTRQQTCLISSELRTPYKILTLWDFMGSAHSLLIELIIDP